MFSRYGDVKLGPDDSEPDYSYLSWFACLIPAFDKAYPIGYFHFDIALGSRPSRASYACS